MSGQEESGKGQPEAQEGSSSQPMAPEAGAVDYRTAPLHDAGAMMYPMQPMASSPPSGGGIGYSVQDSRALQHPQAPPMRRIDQQVTTTATPAVTPDSRQLAQQVMMSPPYAEVRRTGPSPGRGPPVLSVSPQKRSGQSGELFFGDISYAIFRHEYLFYVQSLWNFVLSHLSVQ